MSSPIPLVCVPDAIPAAERKAHFALARRLLQDRAPAIEDLADGYAVRLPATASDDLARFVGNERRCCPALRFEIDVAPGDAGLCLRITGPEGARAFIAAEMLGS